MINMYHDTAIKLKLDFPDAILLHCHVFKVTVVFYILWNYLNLNNIIALFLPYFFIVRFAHKSRRLIINKYIFFNFLPFS